MVEHHPPKVGVAGSSPVCRSTGSKTEAPGLLPGRAASRHGSFPRPRKVGQHIPPQFPPLPAGSRTGKGGLTNRPPFRPLGASMAIWAAGCSRGQHKPWWVRFESHHALQRSFVQPFSSGAYPTGTLSGRPGESPGGGRRTVGSSEKSTVNCPLSTVN